MAPKSARGRKRQTKISFSPATKTLSSTRSSTAAKMGNAPSQTEDCTSTTSKTRGSTRVAQPPRLDSSSEDELAGNTKAGNTRLGKKLHTPIKREGNGMFGSSDVLSARSETEEEQGKVQPHTKPLSRKRQRAVSGSESDHDRPAVTILPRKKQRIVEVREASSEEEDQVDEDEQEEIEEEQEDEEDEEVEEMPKARTRRQVRRQRTPDNTVEVQVQSRSARRLARRPSPASDEDDVLVLPRSRRAKPAPIQTPSDEESEARTPPKSSRRRIRRRASKSASEDQAAEDDGSEAQSDDDDEERNELKEDLAFLKSSPPQDRGRLRSVHGKPKNERQKALEALKRKRAGTTEPPSSATPSRKKPVVVETDSDSELEVIKEEPESDGLIGDEIDDDELEFDEHEPNALDIFQEGEDDIGFIDDNADALIGEPTADADLDDMRLAFSLSRAKTKDLFKHAVEWMVMKKIHPAFDSTRNFYTLTFRKLDDEVKGLAGSKFTSSAWTSEFTRAVRARPDLMANEIGGAADYMSPHCAACNRKNHPATWELMLTGQPYDKDTLEPLENDTSSESDSDSDSYSSSLSATPPRNTDKEKPERDASGEVLPPESHRFFLGSTCKANAQVSHTLYHWRYHLYQWVKQYLAQQGHLTPEKLVKRDKSSNRKREKAAIKIVDKMEADGEIRKLWRLYKEQVTFAVEAVNEFKDGWGRRGR
ncbi:hypothetical protein J1614_003178 [Plenodomus biglobosus]|nr:hypothetical protein J1614_003178 [Plenodomus biglobosus]